MIAATIGFIVCAIIGVWILLICLGMFTWPGQTSKAEKLTAIIVAILVVLFLKWINPFTIAITVLGP